MATSNIQDTVRDLRSIFHFAKLIPSTISIICICNHLIGNCQVFVFVLHLYMFARSLFYIVTNYTSSPSCIEQSHTNNVLLLCFENIVTFAAFICITGNTEDDEGLSAYEIVAISTGVLWGVHLNDITSVHILERATPIGSYRPYHPHDELFVGLTDDI